MVNLEDEHSDELQGVLGKANVAHGNKDLTPALSDSHENRIPPYLRELYDKSICGKFVEEKAVIESLLVQYQDIFSKDETDLGRTHLIEHEIDTGNARPIKQPPRRVPMALAREETEAIQNLESQGVIRESNSPWASPIVLVRKKNGKIRPCVDYRQVNLLTRKDAYPIPRTQECLDTMAGSVIFSSLDMTSGYNQVPIKTTDIPKTAFVTRKALFELVTMPFGLTNAPATFQRLMELICSGLQWTSCLIYLDDILVFGKSFQEHTERLQDVLEGIRLSGLKLKPEKCEIFHEEVRFLGHIISAQGVQPDPMNVSKVLEWPVPKNVTEVRQFRGLCSYYRRFVKNFSVITKPLNNLTTKEASLNWDDICQEAFDTLKTKLASPGVMAFPQDKGTYILDTDACDVGIGAVLCQQQDGVERVVAYGSHSLNRAERDYCVTDKELLAVRYFMEYLRYYLLGRTFMVRTDHQAIRWLFLLKHPKGRIAHWIEILSAYNFSIEYRPGKRHGNADALSRCPYPRDCHCAEQDNLEALRCGPWNKCQKRSLVMGHNETATEQPQQASSEPTRACRKTGDSALSRLRCILSMLLSMIFSILCPTWSQRRQIRVQHDDSPTDENFISVNDESQESILDDGRLWPKSNRSSWLQGSRHGDRVAPAKGKPKTHLSHEMLNYSVIELQREQGKDSNLSKLLDCKLRHEKHLIMR